ncbi:hypothetical protein [Streptomyces sp. NBC_01244]|uniref:hypothetical protein n=1 Tax=Streptomyces sp. NBC_01244 TaxID=2903797 RepID=UPI002E11F565|nr:hypothetical protein OG247_01305 [Streptomyces sp. NBC_01244]
MSLWQSFLGRRGSGSTDDAAASGVQEPPAPEGAPGVYLFHPAQHPPQHLTDAAEWLGPMARDHVVLLVDSGVEDTASLLDQFTPILAAAVRRDVGRVTLVMADGAGSGIAARITEAWPVEVLACNGVPVVGPGGTLFTHRRWLRFAADRAPEIIGRRFPVPVWRAAFSRLAADTAEGHRIDHIPAGIILRPDRYTAPPVPALAHTVPMEASSPVLLVGGPGAAGTSAEAVASVLAALPDRIRRATRLVPWSGDLLPVAKEAAHLLDTEVEVSGGLPLLLDAAAGEAPESRTLLISAEGDPTWNAYVESVVYGPLDGPGGRLKRWRPPFAGLAPGPQDGTYRLSDDWQVTVTRAGLWVGPTGQDTSASERPVEAEVLAIDVGLPGVATDDSLLPVLDGMLSRLEASGLERAMLQIHSDCTTDQLTQLRRITVRHGIGLARRGWLPGAGASSYLPGHAAAGMAEAPPQQPARPAAAVSAPASLMSSTAPSLAPAEQPAAPEAENSIPAVESSQAAQLLALPQIGVPGGSGAAASAGALPSWLTSGTPVRTAEPAEQAVPVAATTALAQAEADVEAEAAPAPAAVEPPAPSAPEPTPEPEPVAVAAPEPAPASAPTVPVGHPVDLRTLLGPAWELHHQAVVRALTRLPSVRSRADDAMRSDLVALHLHLTGGAAVLPEGRRRAAVNAGLRRLPSYRGPALRSSGPSGASHDPVPGTELSADAPISALAADRPLPRTGGDRYLIWSATSRRIRPLLDDGSADADAVEEVVFRAGTRLRVLGVRDGPAGGRLVLLRELPESAPSAVPGELDAQDALFQERLLTWLADSEPRWHEAAVWPERCVGLLTEPPGARRPAAAGSAPALS